jgi:hypothetical protein
VARPIPFPRARGRWEVGSGDWWLVLADRVGAVEARMALLTLPAMAPRVAQASASPPPTSASTSPSPMPARWRRAWLRRAGGALRQHPRQPGRPAAVRAGLACARCRSGDGARRAAGRPGLRAGHAGQLAPAGAHHAGASHVAGVLGQADRRAAGRRAGRRHRARPAAAGRLAAGAAGRGGRQPRVRGRGAAAARGVRRRPRSTRPLGAGQLPRAGAAGAVAPALRMLASCSFVFSIAQLSLTTYLVTYLTDSLAYGLVAAGFMLSDLAGGRGDRPRAVGLRVGPLARRAAHAGAAGRR